mgnify:CR=1 FL=1|jgi:hypothetical protein
MFCPQCGTENPEDARFCKKCGNSLASSLAQPQSAAQAAIWNPNAAANWSLIFTPAFGAYLQMLNWQSLGESERAAASKNWFYAGLGLLVVYVLMGVFIGNSKAADGMARGLGFLFLLVWYFSAGRAQSKYVKEKLGAGYARKPWGKALLLGVASLIGYFIAALIVGLAVGLSR